LTKIFECGARRKKKELEELSRHLQNFVRKQIKGGPMVRALD